MLCKHINLKQQSFEIGTIILILHFRDEKHRLRGTGFFAQGCTASGWQNLDKTQLLWRLLFNPDIHCLICILLMETASRFYLLSFQTKFEQIYYQVSKSPSKLGGWGKEFWRLEYQH